MEKTCPARVKAVFAVCVKQWKNVVVVSTILLPYPQIRSRHGSDGITREREENLSRKAGAIEVSPLGCLRGERHTYGFTLQTKSVCIIERTILSSSITLALENPRYRGWTSVFREIPKESTTSALVLVQRRRMPVTGIHGCTEYKYIPDQAGVLSCKRNTESGRKATAGDPASTESTARIARSVRPP